MRMYQHIGLTTEAYVFLTENAKRVPSSVCPKCSHVISERMDSKVYDEKDVFYGDGPSLREFPLKDGRVAREVLQACPWSSGPIGFLCLEVGTPSGRERGSSGNYDILWKRMFEWTDEEIAKY